MDKFLPRVIRRLSKYSAKQKKSIARVKVAIKKKARLRIDNKTRWSSEYLLLDSHHKGYERDIFGEYPCPIKFEAIEIYMQILHPAFEFCLCMQYTSASISTVVPAVQIIISKLSRMILSPKYQPFVRNLIKAFKLKFDYELNSEVYAVASLLDINTLLEWRTRSDLKDFKQKAIDSLEVVANQFLNNKTNSIQSSQTSSKASQASTTSTRVMNIFSDKSYVDNVQFGK